MRRGSRARRPGGFGVHAPSARPNSSLPDLACGTAFVVMIGRRAGPRDSPWNAGRRNRQGTELLTEERSGGHGVMRHARDIGRSRRGRRGHWCGQRHGRDHRGRNRAGRYRGRGDERRHDRRGGRQPGRRGQSRCYRQSRCHRHSRRGRRPRTREWERAVRHRNVLRPQCGGAVGGTNHRIGTGRQWDERSAVAGQHQRGHLNRIHRRSLGWRRLFVGQLAVQRRRRNTLCRLGSAHHDPVARGILDEMRGVPGRDHAQPAGRLGQRRSGLRLLDVAFQRFLLLLQQLGALTGAAQLIGALSGAVDSHNVRPSPAPSEPMTSTTNGTLAARVRGRRSIDASRLSRRSRNGGRTTLGFLAFRAFARALACWRSSVGPAVRRAVPSARSAARTAACVTHGPAR